ncbi:MAG: RNA polymerase sigma factor [Eubacterium sp.]|nr:RNA polymerase sigma factor [Eubacterium sp.]
MEQEQKWVRDIVRRGSRKAANALVHAYYDDIYSFVYRQIGNREDALDLTQECFFSAFRSIASYDAKKAGVRTWLYHIASHKVIDLRRCRKVQYFPIEDQELVDERDFAEDLVKNLSNQELLRQVEHFVCGMEPHIQEVFRLRVYGEYSFPEIAALFGQPESKIKAQYYRLAAKIRKWIELS